jgi:hypothetical protein
MATALVNTGVQYPDNSIQTTAAVVTIASQAEAVAGTNNTNVITPLRMREGFNAAGTAPVFAARTWVNFNGTGAVAIRASGNVSSITDNGTGLYTVNFSTALSDTDYAWLGLGFSSGTTLLTSVMGQTNDTTARGTTSLAIRSILPSDTIQDSSTVCIAIFR